MFYNSYSNNLSDDHSGFGNFRALTKIDSEGNLYILQPKKDAGDGTTNTHLLKHSGVDGQPLLGGNMDA